jgi:hypothetical protein
MTIWEQIAIGLFVGLIFCIIGVVIDERANNNCFWKIPFYIFCGVFLTLAVCYFFGI